MPRKESQRRSQFSNPQLWKKYPWTMKRTWTSLMNLNMVELHWISSLSRAQNFLFDELKVWIFCFNCSRVIPKQSNRALVTICGNEKDIMTKFPSNSTGDTFVSYPHYFWILTQVLDCIEASEDDVGDGDDYYDEEEYEDDDAELYVSFVLLLLCWCKISIFLIKKQNQWAHFEGRWWGRRRWNFPCWNMVG